LEHCSWTQYHQVHGLLYTLKASRSLIRYTDSIKDVSSKIAKQLVAQYADKNDKGYIIRGGYPGILYPPYYWWQAGAMFGTLLDYWHYTGDDQYNGLVRDGLIHQFGDGLDLVRI
jgi:3-methylcrotonyl-CoA carboxylase beta subunit